MSGGLAVGGTEPEQLSLLADTAIVKLTTVTQVSLELGVVSGALIGRIG
jgi:hypothetical protein